MYKVIFAAVGLFSWGQPVFAQNAHQNFLNQIQAIDEAFQLKKEAAHYFYTKKNKKLACLTIQQAYEVELQSGYSHSSTRATIRKYCG